MISNENVINYEAIDFFGLYNFDLKYVFVYFDIKQ